MNLQDKAKAFAWDMYVNDVEYHSATLSEKLYDMYIQRKINYDDIYLNILFEDWWEDTFIEELQNTYRDTLELLESISHPET